MTLGNWQDPPFNRWSFSHLREIVPTQPIRNTGAIHEPTMALDGELDGLAVGLLDGSETTFSQLLDRTYTDGVVIIQDDKIRYERYFGETQQHVPHLLMSVTKSLVGSVAGNLVEQGLLVPDDHLTKYIPELADSGYAGATVRNVLDMRSGIKFSEEYTDPEAEVRVMEQAFGWRRPDIPRCPVRSMSTWPPLPRSRSTAACSTTGPRRPWCSAGCATRAAQSRMADLIGDLLWTPHGCALPRGDHVRLRRDGDPRRRHVRDGPRPGPVR